MKLSVLGIVLLVLIWGADLGWHSLQVWRVYQRSRTLAQTGWQTVPLAQLSALARQAAPHVSAVRRDVRPLYPLLGLAQALPGKGAALSQVEPVLEAGTDMLEAGTAILPLIEAVWDTPQANHASEPDNLSKPERLVQVLAQNPEQLAMARLGIERALPALQRIQPNLMPANVRDNLLALQDAAPLMLAGARLMPDAAALLGAVQPRTYLVLGQNQDELRPTGGFISAIGSITLDGGRVTAFHLPDSYSVDNPAAQYPLPPEPLQRYMLAGVWLPRDANWSPDFPSAAQQVQALYSISTGTSVDGVVAFDQTAIQTLIKAMGPVTVAGYPEPLTGDNVLLAMRTAWNPGEGQAVNNQWYANRKNFMADMGSAVLGELLSMGSPGTLQTVLVSLIDSLRTGHLQVYFNDPAAQAQLTALDLDGGVHTGQGDFLMLVDWNFGFNKVDALIQRGFSYQVDFSNLRQPVAELTVQYAHTLQRAVTCRHEAQYGQSYEDLQQRCFWDYWRVYAVPGAQLLAAQAPPLPGDYLLNHTAWDGQIDVTSAEEGATVFGGPLMLPAAGQAEIVLRYQMPVGILQAEGGALIYQLRLQKQAGLNSLPVRVRVVPPAGYRVESLSGTWRDDQGSAVWQSTLTQSHVLRLRFVPPPE